MGNLHKNIQLMLEFLKSGLALLLLYTNDLPGHGICNFAIFADDTAHNLKLDQESDLWQQLELASELNSDLRDNVDSGRKWLVDFNLEKLN